VAPEGADFLAAYSAAVPTGKYALGATDNGGLGQWGHFFQAGTAVQLDRKEPVEFSLLTTYGIHTRKRGTDITVGNVVALEGGLGYALYKKQKMKHPVPVDVGVVYYAQFKVTPDRVNGVQRPVIQNSLAGHKDRVYGLGGELD
jgi:hypothetical protein